MRKGTSIARLWTATRLYIMVVFSGVAFLLPACKMGPDYTRPETPKAESWKVTASTAESIANLPWWELLKDQELQRLVRMAIEENLDLQIAAANIEEFRAQLMIAKFDLVPSLDYSGTAFGYRNTNNNVFPIGPGAVPLGGKDDGLSLSHEGADVGLKWEVDLWGRIRRSIEAARAQLLSKSENQRAVILGLVSNVAEAYFNLRGLDYEVEITKRTLKSWEESVRLSELRFKQGVIPKLDLDRFQAERAGAAAQLADLERQVVQEENRLSILLGRRPAEIAKRAPPHRATDSSCRPARTPVGSSSTATGHPEGRARPGGGDRQHRRGSGGPVPAIGIDRRDRWSRASNLRVLLWTVRHLQRGCLFERPTLQRVGIGLSDEGDGGPGSGGCGPIQKDRVDRVHGSGGCADCRPKDR